MAFWGAEVTQGKPYIHRFDSELGRLRLSQATLGSGNSKNRSVVKCTVGDKPPINLCSLLPEKIETTPLNLEFEEEDEVTFSVEGPTSVHLSGFFYGDESEDGCGEDCEDDCELDHYAEDISDSEEDSENSLDFDGSSDEELDMFPAPRKANSGVIIEEIDNEKLINEKASTEQKKGSAHPISDSEDEDGFPKSSAGKKETEKMDEGSLKKKTKNGSEPSNNLKRKIEVREDGEPAQANANDVVSDTKSKKQNKRNKVEKEAEARVSSENLDSVNTESAAKEEISQKAINEKKDKKKKKKNKKQDDAADLNKKESIVTKEKPKEESIVTKEKPSKTKKEASQVRTFPNGLVVEEVAMGKPDGKKASNGKKVSVRYIGKLQKNGKIFDSNIGKAPFQFRLGVGEVIKGWDVGVNGMRVGDKRRLIIPPSMGYGAKGAGNAIPGNAVLLFDVELMDVK